MLGRSSSLGFLPRCWRPFLLELLVSVSWCFSFMGRCISFLLKMNGRAPPIGLKKKKSIVESIHFWTYCACAILARLCFACSLGDLGSGNSVALMGGALVLTDPLGVPIAPHWLGQIFMFEPTRDDL